MDPALVILPLLALAVVALVLAERAGSRGGLWATKPVASALFVALAIADGAPTSMVSWLLLAALVVSFVGDILLVPQAARVFRAGILVFLAAHVLFVGAFLALGIVWAWVGLALVPLLVAAWLVARWLLPKVTPALRNAVLAYMGIITVMVALATGAVAAGATPLFLVAALAFYVNDILVARDRFVVKAWVHRAVGLPLYYGAMALFALQVT